MLHCQLVMENVRYTIQKEVIIKTEVRGPSFQLWFIGLSALVRVGLAVLMIDCATIMNGTTQGIGFSSTPPGASI